MSQIASLAFAASCELKNKIKGTEELFVRVWHVSVSLVSMRVLV